MKAQLRTFHRFIVRALLRDRMRSAITVVGISLGVGVVLAIRVANSSSLESFRAATLAVAGEASIRVSGPVGRFDEAVLGQLGWLKQYGKISPVVEGYAMFAGVPGRADSSSGTGEFLQVLGVDILRDRSLRSYRLVISEAKDSKSGPWEWLALLSDPRAVILTEQFAAKQGLSVGSAVTLVIGSSPHDFTVRGLLVEEGPARALGGKFALMDIAAAQWAFGCVGQVDWLDVRLREGLSSTDATKEIAQRLPPGLVSSSADAGYSQVEKLISAFHFNLNSVASIALLVGLFLIYNTVSVSVIARREEIGTMRSLGATRLTVLGWFLGEAFLLAAVGAAIGIGLGQLMANAAVRVTATTVETFYIAAAATEAGALGSVGSREVMLAFAIALPLSLVAAAVPALEASNVRPVEAMRGAVRLRRSVTPSPRFLFVSATLFAIGYGLSRLGPIDGLPVFGYLAGLTIMFGGCFLAPHALWLASVASGRLARGAGRAAVRLASANLRGAIRRVSISVAALGVSLAMMVAISIMVGSFRETVAYWVDETMRADIYAKPATRTAAASVGQMDEDAVDSIRADPDVAAVDHYTAQSMTYQGSLVTVGSGDFAVLLEHGRLLFKSPEDARLRMREAIGRDSAVVSESFALLFGKNPGDEIELPTIEGPKNFLIAAVYYNYSNNRGTVVLDRLTYARWFPRAEPTSVSIYLKPEADPAQVSRRLARVVGARHRLVFTTNSQVRSQVMRIFDSTFTITYALEAIAIAVAGLGVLSTLTTLILERRRETSMLRFLGATKSQIRRMVSTEAVLIGGVSQLIGVLVGVMLSFLLVYVINVQSFGWTIQYHFPTGFLIQSTVFMLGFAALVGLYPAAQAVAADPVRFAREE